MKLIDLVRAWVAEQYKPGEVVFEEWQPDEYDMYISSFPHGQMFSNFIIIRSTGIYNSRYDSGGMYISAEDPKFFNKLKAEIDIAMHHRIAWANEINDEESEMLFEETYYYGGYAT